MHARISPRELAPRDQVAPRCGRRATSWDERSVHDAAHEEARESLSVEVALGRVVRRGLERYAPTKGYDVGQHARQKYAQLVVQKAGIFPGDWVLDVETGTGILGVQVARSFTRAKVVATDSDRVNLKRAAENAVAEGCADRLRFVQCLPDALPFKDEKFYFTTMGLALSLQEEPLDVLDEIHRTTGFSAKIYMPALDMTKVKKKLRGTNTWVFDAETIAAMREIGFGKVQPLRVAMLADGAQLYLVTAKRFDGEDEASDDGDDAEDDEGDDD